MARRPQQKHFGWKALWLLLTIAAESVLFFTYTLVLALNQKCEISQVRPSLFVLLPVIASVIASAILWLRFNARCNRCKTWGALRFYDEKIVDSRPIVMVVSNATRNNKGEQTGSQDQHVPGTRMRIRETYVCRKCQNKYAQSRIVEEVAARFF